MTTTNTARSDRIGAREAEARAEFAQTAISPAVAWLLGGVLVAATVAVPAWAWLAPPSAQLRSRDVYDMFEGGGGTQQQGTLAGRVAAAWRGAEGDRFARLLAANRALREELEAIDDGLADRNPLLSTLGEPLQRWFVLGTGASTERVHPGRDRISYSAPAVAALTGPGFLSERSLARGADADPRPAIAAFAALVAARGGELVLVPVPGKAAIHPDRLASGLPPTAAPVRNPSWDEFVRDVRAMGVHVVDLASELAAAANEQGELQYLRTDTHWTPQAMERAAAVVAESVRALGVLPDSESPGFESREFELTGQGDLARILHVAADDPDYGAEQIVVHAVLDRSGLPWRPQAEADVLLLGDSFTNIYADERMGFGRAAGFAEHLALALDREIDRLARNDDGAFATRRDLARERERGNDRLAGKRVVIWQFAARELAVGRWLVTP